MELRNGQFCILLSSSLRNMYRKVAHPTLETKWQDFNNPKFFKNPPKSKKWTVKKTTQKNDTLRPAKRGSHNAAPHIKKRYFMTCQTRYFFRWITTPFLTKLGHTFGQSPWPFWFKVGTIWFKVGGHFGSNLWRQFWSGVLRITQCYECLAYKDFGPVRKVSFFIWLKYLIWRENLPPTWTKICHQLGQKFATNLNKSWPPNGHTIEKKRYFMSCRSLYL